MLKLKHKEEYVVDERGRKTAVVIDIAAYKAMIEHLENLEDALELDESVRSANGFRPYSEIRAEMKDAGRL